PSVRRKIRLESRNVECWAGSVFNHDLGRLRGADLRYDAESQQHWGGSSVKERRQHKRFKRRYMVRYGERELTHSGFNFDVSRGGCFIVSPYRPPLDANLHVQIFLEPETSVYFEAQVRRHKVVPPELRSVEKGGFGVRFLRPDEILANILVESA